MSVENEGNLEVRVGDGSLEDALRKFLKKSQPIERQARARMRVGANKNNKKGNRKQWKKRQKRKAVRLKYDGNGDEMTNDEAAQERDKFLRAAYEREGLRKGPQRYDRRGDGEEDW